MRLLGPPVRPMRPLVLALLEPERVGRGAAGSRKIQERGAPSVSPRREILVFLFSRNIYV